MKVYNEVYSGAAYVIASSAVVPDTSGSTTDTLLAATAVPWKIGADTVTVTTGAAIAANDIIEMDVSKERMVVVSVDSSGANDILSVMRGFSWTATPATSYVYAGGEALTKVGSWNMYDNSANYFVDTIEDVTITKESEQTTLETNYRGDVKIVNSKSSYKAALSLPTNFLANQLKKVFTDLDVIEDSNNKSVANMDVERGLTITPISIFILPVETSDVDRSWLFYKAAHNNALDYAYSPTDQAKLPIEYTGLADNVFDTIVTYGAVPVPSME